MDAIPEAASGPVAAAYQMLNPSPSVPSDWLPLELTLPEYLRNVTGVEDLSQLRHLKLRVITGEASIQRISVYAPSLVHLDLQGSCLGSLRDLGCGLLALEVLSVSRCGLNSLDGTFGFPSLKEFTASYNKIKDVGPCSVIENLKFLDVSGNPINDIDCVGFLCLCLELEELVLLECPVTGTPHYRRRVHEILPTLKILDNLNFSDHPLSADESSEEEKEDSNPEEEDEDEGCSGEAKSPVEAKKEEFERDVKIAGNSKEGGEISQSPTNSEADNRAAASNGGLPERVPLRKVRPTSAAARMQSWAPTLPVISTGTVRRPQTARPRPVTDHWSGEEDSSFPNRILLYDESPSSLTSGDAMCGNIASALLSNRSRSRTARMDAMRKTLPPLKKPIDICDTTDIQEKRLTCCRDDILEASRKWREAYARFRQKNRTKWEKEAEEDDNQDAEGDEGDRRKERK